MQVRVLWWLWRENLRRAVVLQLVTACSDISPHISRSAAPLYLSGLDEYRDAADQLVGDEISEQAIISCQTIAHPKFSLFTFENEGSFNIFRLFWSVDFSRCRATIMPFKVCEIVSAQKLIRAGDDADSWKIDSLKPADLHIFRLLWNRRIRLDRLYSCCHEKFFVRQFLCEVQGRWPNDCDSCIHHSNCNLKPILLSLKEKSENWKRSSWYFVLDILAWSLL